MARGGGPFLMVLRNGSPIGPPIGPPIGRRGISGFCRSRRGGCLEPGQRGAVLSPGADQRRGARHGLVAPEAGGLAGPGRGRGGRHAVIAAALSRASNAIRLSGSGDPGTRRHARAAAPMPSCRCGLGWKGRPAAPLRIPLSRRRWCRIKPWSRPGAIVPPDLRFRSGGHRRTGAPVEAGRNYCGTILRNATAWVFQYPPLNSESSIFSPVFGLSRTRFSPKKIPT